MKARESPLYSGDMLPGTLLMPIRSQSLPGVDAYEDSSMSRRSGHQLTNRDAPFLVIANLPPEQADVTYRPTLVLTASGQLAWVVDFMLERIIVQ